MGDLVRTPARTSGSVLFVDDDNGFASNLGAGLASTITDTNVLYNTKDGGMTWTPP